PLQRAVDLSLRPLRSRNHGEGEGRHAARFSGEAFPPKSAVQRARAGPRADAPALRPQPQLNVSQSAATQPIASTRADWPSNRSFMTASFVVLRERLAGEWEQNKNFRATAPPLPNEAISAKNCACRGLTRRCNTRPNQY